MSYRVVQWATGSMGKTCLRAVIDHPELELVGLFVYSDSKVGLDAGEIARREPTGVIATNDIEDILQLEADVVFHTAQIKAPYSHHNGDLCRLLASGKNVISINGHSYPRYWGEEYTRPLLDPNDLHWEPAQILNGMYSEVVAHLVQRLGCTLERIETDHVMYPASRDIDMAAGLIRKGTVSHTHWRWHGIVDGSRLVTQAIHWVMETAHLDDPDYTIWTVRVQGLPDLDIRIDLKNPADHPFRTTPEQYGVAGSLVNAVPGVVAAPPGFRVLPLADLYRAG